ncbi:hypothetical protein R6P07_000989 [Salmonella enterica]|nr:hypothetical protein [Salmonella enterica]
MGDVSKLELALSVETLTHKESYSGQRATTRRIITSKDATVTSTWYEFSAENLATQLYGERAIIAAGTVTGEALPDNILAGDRLSLAHQNVSDVVIGTLTEGTDYTVDALYGALTFLTPQAKAQSVNYSHSGGVNTTLFIFIMPLALITISMGRATLLLVPLCCISPEIPGLMVRKKPMNNPVPQGRAGYISAVRAIRSSVMMPLSPPVTVTWLFRPDRIFFIISGLVCLIKKVITPGGSICTGAARPCRLIITIMYLIPMSGLNCPVKQG